jgi:integrase
LSYRRAAEQFTEATNGWTLHQLRHSALTHLAEDGVDVALLKAKSRHRSLRSLERYVRPSEASVARLTAEHDRSRRR